MEYKKIDMQFLKMFDGGIEGEAWIELRKKHNSKKIIELLNTELSEENMKTMIECEDYKTISNIILSIVKKATVVSVFEKVAFQKFIEIEEIHFPLSMAMFSFLYDFGEESFNKMVNVLSIYKKDSKLNVSKWPIISCFKAYQDMEKFVFVKPNTVKAISILLEYDIEYKPKLNFKTYENVRKMISNYRDNSMLCKNQNLMVTQAILFCVTNYNKSE